MSKNINGWQSFIDSQTISPLTLQDIQNAPETWMCDLAQWGILRVCGVDAFKFLQGQISCDVAKVEKQSLQMAACVNLKGRMLCNFIVYKADEQHYYLFCPPNTLSITAAVLKKYAIFSKVNIEEDLSVALAAGLNLSAHKTQDIQCLNLAALNFQLYFAASENNRMQDLWTNCLQNNQVLSSDYFNYQCIQLGVFFITPACSELFTPQEINFELIHGISFTKGCYTGQEVVARLHYRGIPKRRCYLAEIEKSSNEISEIHSASEIRDCQNKAQGHLLEILSIENRNFALISLSTQSYEDFIKISAKKITSNSGLHIAECTIFLFISPPPYPLSL